MAMRNPRQRFWTLTLARKNGLRQISATKIALKCYIGWRIHHVSDNSRMAVPIRPRPLPDDASAGYWQAANEGRLAIQRCGHCRRWNHAPSMNCPACGSVDLGFEDVCGQATLFSWTVIHHSPGPAFEDKLPLLVGIVELVEQPHLLVVSNLLGCRSEDLKLGMPLLVEFERIGKDCALPQFRPAGGLG